MRLLGLVCLVALITRGNVIAQGSAPEAPVTRLAIGIPGDPQTLLASTVNHGLFRSSNGGASWDRVLDASVGALEVSRVDPRVVWAGTLRSRPGAPSRGVLLSRDGGRTWGEAGLTNGSILAIAPSPSLPSAAFVALAGDGGGVFRTDDGGVTWRHVLLGEAALDVLVNPADPSRVIAVILADQVYSIWGSTDGGEIWRKESQDIGRSVDLCLSIRGRTSPLATFRSDSSSATRLILVDWGSTWRWDATSGWGPSAPAPGLQICESWLALGTMEKAVEYSPMWIDPTDANRWIGVSRTSGIQITDNGGVSWMPIALTSGSIASIAPGSREPGQATPVEDSGPAPVVPRSPDEAAITRAEVEAERALLATNDGDFPRALRLFESALQALGSSYQLHYNIAWTAFETKDLAKARGHIFRALELAAEQSEERKIALGLAAEIEEAVEVRNRAAEAERRRAAAAQAQAETQRRNAEEARRAREARLTAARSWSSPLPTVNAPFQLASDAIPGACTRPLEAKESLPCVFPPRCESAFTKQGLVLKNREAGMCEIQLLRTRYPFLLGMTITPLKGGNSGVAGVKLDADQGIAFGFGIAPEDDGELRGWGAGSIEAAWTGHVSWPCCGKKNGPWYFELEVRDTSVHVFVNGAPAFAGYMRAAPSGYLLLQIENDKNSGSEWAFRDVRVIALRDTPQGMKP